MTTQIEQSKNVILEKCGGEIPKIAITLGSGLGELAQSLTDATIIQYSDLPGFPTPSVQGHVGELHIGKLNGVPVICLKGRVHLYEGLDKIANLKVMIRTLKAV
ncbi:MAG: purine-nucleoside phosphorylase, partial [Alphaproteobacteria bacterium]